MTELFAHPLFVPLLLSVAIVGIFPLMAGYLTLVERKVLADMQTRLGPMRVGPYGLLQPLADALKLLLKEDVIPAESDRFLFWIAPVVTTITALVAMTIIPFSDRLFVADVNVGLLIFAAMGALGIFGIILGGWSSNSHYPLLGALRSAAQLVSYEVALGLGLLCGVITAGSLSLVQIVHAQEQRQIWFVFENFGMMVLAFFVFFVAAAAETNRPPFDLPEADSELVAGFHTEYSGMRFGLFMLAEYGNLFLVSSIAVTLFWGGWLRPFSNLSWLSIPFNYAFPFALFAYIGVSCFRLSRQEPHRGFAALLQGVGVVMILLGALFLIPFLNPYIAAPFWFFFKVAVIIYLFIWFRGTFPRFRYDQLMDLGWKFLIPFGLVVVFLNALAGLIRG